MDPIMRVNHANGNGTVTFYAWGKSWNAEVREWTVQLMSYQAPDSAVMKYAQKLVNRYYAGIERY